jgi:hypothetical protein
MQTPLFQSFDCQTIAKMQSERLRMRAELVEVIANARDTIARSWLLLAEADAMLAREKSPLLNRAAS